MFNQYEPNVKAVIVFLKLLGVKVTNTSVDETLQNHPDYPGLLSISDSLSRWNVPNAALKINFSQIDEIESPFIAFVNNELPILLFKFRKDEKVRTSRKIIKPGRTKKYWRRTYTSCEHNLYMFRSRNISSMRHHL